jgi:acyl-CoA thioester hydrolase
MTNDIALDDFPCRTSDKIRYADTDRQGHVNNAIFATLLETGRVEILYEPSSPLADPGSAFVIARLVLDFHAEISWPGTVQIGTRVVAIGRSSVTLEQGLFQDGQCVATAETIIVHMDETTRRSRPLSQAATERFASLTTAYSSSTQVGSSHSVRPDGQA